MENNPTIDLLLGDVETCKVILIILNVVATSYVLFLC